MTGEWEELLAEVDRAEAELWARGAVTAGQATVRIGGPAWDQPGADPLGDLLAWVAAYQQARGWAA